MTKPISKMVQATNGPRLPIVFTGSATEQCPHRWEVRGLDRDDIDRLLPAGHQLHVQAFALWLWKTRCASIAALTAAGLTKSLIAPLCQQPRELVNKTLPM